MLMTEMSEENISFEAVDNEQFLNYQTITDLRKFGDQVYITTLSGFYRRDWEDFIRSRLN